MAGWSCSGSSRSKNTRAGWRRCSPSTSRRVNTATHLKRLDAHMRALAQDLRRPDRGRAPRRATAPAAEWLLDNFHVISAAARDIRHDLPPEFYQRLPSVAADEFAGLPRIYAMALELIGHSAGRLDPQRLHRFVSAFQSITPLTMGELWAWPSVLKLALIEYLRARADALAASRAQRLAADRPGRLARAGAGRAPGRRRASGVRRPPAAPFARARDRTPGCCEANWTSGWPRAARRSRTRFAPKDGTRRPRRPSCRACSAACT